MWNVWGLCTSKRRVKLLVRKFDVSILAISEPFHNAVNLERWAHSIDFPAACENLALGGEIMDLLERRS